MSSQPGSEPIAVDIADLSHRLKGLCGIFDMLQSGLPEDPDLRHVFEQGMKRMRDIIASLDAGQSSKS